MMKSYWLLFVLACVVGTALGLATPSRTELAREAVREELQARSREFAAPPPGGFVFELVVGAQGVTVYRFRDGPRVCYVAAASSAADTISCVVSP